MSDEAGDRGPGARSRRPTRGSADELLDAGAHAPIDAMRHSAAHVMAEAVLDLFPGARLGIGPAIDERLLLRLRPAAPADARRPRRDRGAHARRASPPATRSSAARSPSPRRGRWPSTAGQAYKVEILDDLAARAAAAGEPLPVDDASTSTARSATCARARTSPRPAGIGPFKLLVRRRRLLARRREAADAPADLRDGLGVAGGAGPVPVAPRGGEEARPPQAGRAPRPVQLPRREPGCRLLAPEGLAPLPDAARTRCASSRSGAATRRSTRRRSSTRSSGSSPATGTTTATTCSSSRPRSQTFSLKPMNCPESHVHLPQPAALLPRPAAAPGRVRRAPPQRAVRASSRA